MPNVMAALPNIGAALCSTPRSLADVQSTTRVPCSNAAKTRNPLKFGGVPQICQQISAVSGPKFTILWGHLEDILLPKYTVNHKNVIFMTITLANLNRFL